VERKKLIRRAALAGLIVLVVSGLAALIAARAFELEWQGRVRRMDERLTRLGQEYQAYLDETAKKIHGLPADPKVIGEIQARHFQEQPDRWLYVWASTNDGEFSFGVPPEAFARLNAVYDKNRDAIAEDNHYASRDQFLRVLLHIPRELVLAEPSPEPEEPGKGSRRARPVPSGDSWWRFYREEENHWDLHRPNGISLSSPIQSASGQTVGNLNLKLVEVKDAALYWSRSRFENEGGPGRVVGNIATGVAIASLVWLWFLLPSWVYIDARERNVPRPLLWAVLILVGGVFALLVYLVSRPVDVAEFRCPKCGKLLNGSKAGCPYCGADLSAVFCSQCQYPLKPDWAFCPSCRTPVSRHAEASPPPDKPPA
jgi:RNA polymerase subunit RPABC4/transcription elongation factor Spt4